MPKRVGFTTPALHANFELQRSWEEAGKSYILAAYNHGYANLPSLVEECHRIATVCYFNAAESAHLNNELQTAYDFYTLILAKSVKKFLHRQKWLAKHKN